MNRQLSLLWKAVLLGALAISIVALSTTYMATLKIDGATDTALHAEQLAIEAMGGYTELATTHFRHVTADTGISVETGGIDVDAGGVNVDAGGLTVSAGAVNLGSGATTLTGAAVLASTLDVTGTGTFTGGLAADTIAENTAGTGVTADGVLMKDGGVTTTAASVFASSARVEGNDKDLTVTAPTDGGNADAKNQFVGVPKLGGFVLGAMTDASETVTGYIDETPAGEWTSGTNITETTESSIFRKGTASLKLEFGTAVTTTDYVTNTLGGGDQDWSDDDSVGLWLRCDTTTSAGDLTLTITDGGAGATAVDVPALATADHWTWVEIDVSGVANASKDVITDIAWGVDAGGATALAGQVCYFDSMVKWDAAEEEAMTLDVFEDGVIAIYTVTTAEGQANTPALLTEWTDYFVHYESGNDFVVAITDQSANSAWGLAALE